MPISYTLPVESNYLPSPWKKHDLKVSLDACRADVAHYIGRFAALRFRMVTWLFSISTVPAQRALAKQIESKHCCARAEGIARLYLGGRKSVAFHNHFPIALHLPPNVASNCLDTSVALIESLGRILRSSPSYASLFSMAREPARFCDHLRSTLDSQFFVVLHLGSIYWITLDLATHQETLYSTLQNILAKNHKISASDEPRLGEMTVLPRDDWQKLHSSLIKHDDAAHALHALRNAAFLACLDDKNSPKEISALGIDLRFSNIANRFFDKCLQFIAFGNGELGFLCDHSVIDGIEATALASALHEEMQKTTRTISNAQTTPEKFSKTTREIKYSIPTGLSQRSADFFNLQRKEVFSHSVVLPKFNQSLYATTSHKVDSLIQLAIQLAFYRCFGRMPSVFEPVSLSHLVGGRLDFISPVSNASIELVVAITKESSNHTINNLLCRAIDEHRKQVRTAKMGLGHIGHLLAVSTLEIPNKQRLGAYWIHTKERFFAAIDLGSFVLTQRDVIASNGGSQYQHAVKLFGSMTHKPNAFAIGYSIGHTALTLDIQAHGKYASAGNKFINELNRALCYFLEANLAEAT